MGVSHPEILGPITPVKGITPEVQVLIEGEFSEDSSDEEYEPDDEEDDKDIENSIESFDSQPSTPATPAECDSYINLEEEQPTSPEVKYDQEGVFKIPHLYKKFLFYFFFCFLNFINL